MSIQLQDFAPTTLKLVLPWEYVWKKWCYSFHDFVSLILGRPKKWFSDFSITSRTLKTLFWTKFKKKTVKKPFLGFFLGSFWPKNCVFLANSPSKLVLFGAVDACRKNLRLVGQKWMSKNNTNGIHFWAFGRPNLCSLNPLLVLWKLKKNVN